MGLDDLQFVRTIIAEARRNGGVVSRNVIKECYYADVEKNGVVESMTVSEKWIDYYSKKLNGVPFSQLERASRSATEFPKLLMTLLGK